jgi:hypothetical protein
MRFYVIYAREGVDESQSGVGTYSVTKYTYFVVAFFTLV